MPPRVVAVVCAYWPNRRENVKRIIRDLQTSTRAPDRILVLNNHHDPLPAIVEGAEVINAPNMTCRGKFIAALFDVADYYLLLDDDTSVGPRTIEALLQHARRGICTGYLGCWLDPATGSVNSGNRLWPHDATQETVCQTFCGCALFMSFDAIVRMLMLEERVRVQGRWHTEGDDILAGLANRSTVVPLRDDAKFVDLGYQEQAMCYSHPDYYGMRDEFTKDVVEALKVPLPDWEV